MGEVINPAYGVRHRIDWAYPRRKRKIGATINAGYRAMTPSLVRLFSLWYDLRQPAFRRPRLPARTRPRRERPVLDPAAMSVALKRDIGLLDGRPTCRRPERDLG